MCCLAWPGLASPRLAPPAAPRLPCLALPCPALPCLPCHTCRATPFLALPSLALPAMTGPAFAGLPGQSCVDSLDDGQDLFKRGVFVLKGLSVPPRICQQLLAVVWDSDCCLERHVMTSRAFVLHGFRRDVDEGANSELPTLAWSVGDADAANELTGLHQAVLPRGFSVIPLEVLMEWRAFWSRCFQHLFRRQCPAVFLRDLPEEFLKRCCLVWFRFHGRECGPFIVMPITPCVALPSPATPRLATPAVPGRASPGRAEPRLPCRALPGLVLPRRASPCLPRLAAPRRAKPCHACRAWPGQATPSLACHAVPGQARPGRASPAAPGDSSPRRVTPRPACNVALTINLRCGRCPSPCQRSFWRMGDPRRPRLERRPG
jgi:hypothetical protein